MGRGTGTGLTALGIVLLIVGAILRFAVQVDTRGFDIQEAGLILLVAGGVALFVGIVTLVMGSYRRSTVQGSVQQTPTGERFTEERVDSGASSGL
jgi:uncharacterized membrane protein